MYQRVGKAAYKANLENTIKLAAYLDHPEQGFKSVHVAGTNGKGSTCAMLEHIYSKAGYRVGTYVSPHLLHYNERVRVNQQNISDDDLCLAFSAIEAARGSVVLTYFEMGTLAAIWHFSKVNLDVILLEVGMGGRLDAVNAFESGKPLDANVIRQHANKFSTSRFLEEFQNFVTDKFIKGEH